MDTDILVAIIGATATISAAIVTIIFRTSEKKRRKAEEEEMHSPITQIKLFEKELFSKADYWVNYTIKRLGFEQGDRNWIYETIMKNEIEVVSSMTKEFLEEYDLMDLSQIKFENLIFSLISEFIEIYNEKIKKDFCDHFGQNKGERIFNLVMDKQPSKESQSMGFNVWHSATITYMEKSIKDHCSAYYPNNVERMEMVIDEFKCGIGAAHTHLFKTFGNFNGELDYLLAL